MVKGNIIRTPERLISLSNGSLFVVQPADLKKISFFFAIALPDVNLPAKI
jgi:hypothetical protein